MREFRKRVAPGLALCTGLVLGLTASSHAQSIFQSTYGGKLEDAARGGTIRTSDGGILTVGESRSFSPGGDYDVYVVKTDACGNLQWSATYDIGRGGDDFGRKVRETVDGNFVIVGSTNNNAGCSSKYPDIFVLNIDGKGSVNWANTYGGSFADDGTDIQLFNGGKEYVVSGRSASFGAGSYDAYLMDIDFGGNVNWARVYGGGAYDGFNALTVAANGDIIATGETFSYNFGDDQIYLVRVDGKGNFSSPLNFSYHYGGSKSNEAGNDVVEINQKFIGVVGYTDAGGTRDPYVLKVFADGTCFCDNTFINPRDKSDDVFNEVEATPDGDLYVVGTDRNITFGFGGTDMMLVRIDQKCGFAWGRLYGMTENEEGHSLHVEYDPANPSAVYSFLLAGVTTSCCFGSEDVYLVGADANGVSGCNENDLKLDQQSPGYCPQKAPTGNPLVYNWCAVKAEPVYFDSWKPLCQSCQDGNLMPGNREHLGGNLHQQGVLQTTAVRTAARTRVAGSQR
ncbi:MAG TPA: hypothetical protein VHI13_20730 [Candidatus Kapabacteria bacterium]|nr:hypothetical protein [Candidatus Kapabacteria bacterium]